MATNVTLKRVSNTDGTTDELHPSTSWGQIDANTIPGDFNPSSHTHGLISNAGKITSNTAIASGDRLVFSNYSDGGTLVNSSITFGTGTTTFLRNDGTWATPNDVDTNNYLTGVSGSGNGTVTFTRSGLSNLTWDASHSHSEYLPLAGGTMTGDLTVTSGNNNGIFIGNGGANITSVTPSSKDIVIQDVAQIRFGSASWDWNTWAGLAFNDSTEVLTIGGPASSVFSSNSNPPLIDVNFDGLNTSGLKVNNNTVWHDGIFEPIVDNLDVLPTYTSSNEDFIKYNTTERAIEVQGSDDSFGAVYPAIKTESGVSYKISFSIKSNTTTTSGGVYFRPQEYDSALPDGKTHIAGNATHSEVQEATRQLTSFYENQNIGTSWEQHSFFYTPTSTAVWFSLMFLNWTGLGTNSLFIKNLRVDAIQEDSADANTLDGLDSTQFVRSDTSDTMSGDYRIESGSFASLILDRGTTGAGSIVQFENNNGIIGGVGAYGDDGLQFRTKDGTQMVLDANNRLGIGTTSPSSLLHISSGTSGDAVLTIEADTDNNNEADSPQIHFKQDGGNTFNKVGIIGNANDVFTGSLANHSYIGGNNGLHLIANNVPKMTIDTSGKVSIGTTTPLTTGGAHLLTIATPGTQGLIMGASTTDLAYIRRLQAEKYQWQTYGTSGNGGEIHLQPYGGNVGIGTTSPSAKLDVAGSARFDGPVNVETNSTASRAFYVSRVGTTQALRFYTTDNISYIDTIQDENTGIYGSLAISADMEAPDSYISLTGNTIRLSGDVGIGTASPGVKLQVQANTSSPAMYIGNSNAGGYSSISFRNQANTSNIAHIGFGNASAGNTTLQNKAFFGTIGANDAVITTSDTVRMTVASGGNVGIGTTTPGEKLEVNGKIKVNNEVIATKLVDYNNGNYYVDPASTSNINNLTVQGNLTVNGTTTTLDTTVSTTDQWTVTNAGTDVATIINQTGTADILDVRDNGTSVFKVKDGGNVEMKTDSKFTVGASTTVNEAKIILDASNAGHPQIGLAENNDASWALGVDDLDNSFKIHGAASSTIPTIGGLTTPHLELDTTGNMWLQKRLYFTSNAYMEYNSTNDSIDFFFT